jgi:hypothetical protein
VPEPPYITSGNGTVRPGRTTSGDDLPVLGLDGMDISWIHIDFQVRLVFAQVKTEVTIGTASEFTAPGREYSLNPEARSDLGPLLAVYPATVGSASISSGLALKLQFTSGAAIEVPQDPHYEAWQIAGPGSRLIVCPPAGSKGLAVWD